MNRYVPKAVLLAMTLFVVAACKPAGPPPDLVKTQRESLDKAKAVSGQVLENAEQQKKDIEEGTK